ncbi:hypothetical protein HYC85_003941 [Camellia sinensis]|uniref:Uncharacterized protein n=1 Tax=Camellia sinensis TaxID=4442 RepID=A0A7J7HX75_CAMSI|nr:hypothetical protein HYC85_003941 [Camellia sinensis]
MAKPRKSKTSSEEALCNASNISEEDKEKIEAVVKYKSPWTVNSAGHRQEQEQDHENEEDVNSVSLQSHSTLPPFTFLDGVGEESTQSASWKHVCVSAPPGGTFKRRVFWNGAIHWMNSMNLHIRFDVDGENLTGTPMPPYPKILSEDKILYFGECHGHLFLIQNRQSFPVGFRILEMNRDYCCWNVMYRVNLRPIIDVFPSKIYPKFNVLCVVKGANEEDIALVLAIPGKVISYNLKSKTLKQMVMSLSELF